VTFDEFVAARLQALLGYAVMLTGDPHLAKDLVQETMVRVYLKWRRVSATTVPEIYVKRMPTNAYLDHRRGPWFRRVVLRHEPDEQPTRTDHAEALVARAEIWSLLAVLPARQRAAPVPALLRGVGRRPDRGGTGVRRGHRPIIGTPQARVII
jgi:DNA-directed RNA polymerase specialized sigma24 family protein